MKKLVLFSLLLMSCNIFAKNEIIFQCTTTNNKIVSVESNKSLVFYKFGKNLNTPELAFSVPKKSTSTYQWAGVGRAIYYDVDVPNGDVIYTLYSSIDRMSSEHETESGIIVTNKNQQIARILCNENKKSYINNLEDIDLPSKN